ncbi:dihydroxyacetone kinase subunit DhaL [Anaerosinus massiliensis]|uniref:dihydroxyacetone kinase subunit DhaL n=1 Tax=Massilibacillus massiliensis TaxID=1806837 RepID=UPI000AB3AE12|nr:dihydroxyacetone kinase subunit DhaL [Massilibacillus massiliensis]
MEKITKECLREILGNISKVMEEEKAYLIELDGKMGDGDLGLTMSTGFRAVYEEIQNLDETDMGKIFMKLGMKMNAVVPSTMGTLISTCFVKAAAKAKGKTELVLADIVEMGFSAVQGVMDRGKSKVGDKTMLDALVPAVEALQEAHQNGMSLAKANELAYRAAKEGAVCTKCMQSVHGRAAYYNEKSIGHPDSGAIAVMFIWKGIWQSFK